MGGNLRLVKSILPVEGEKVKLALTRFPPVTKNIAVGPTNTPHLITCRLSTYLGPL
jgi:hypothetical protein